MYSLRFEAAISPLVRAGRADLIRLPIIENSRFQRGLNRFHDSISSACLIALLLPAAPDSPLLVASNGTIVQAWTKPTISAHDLGAFETPEGLLNLICRKSFARCGGQGRASATVLAGLTAVGLEAAPGWRGYSADGTVLLGFASAASSSRRGWSGLRGMALAGHERICAISNGTASSATDRLGFFMMLAVSKPTGRRFLSGAAKTVTNSGSSCHLKTVTNMTI